MLIFAPYIIDLFHSHILYKCYCHNIAIIKSFDQGKILPFRRKVIIKNNLVQIIVKLQLKFHMVNSFFFCEIIRLQYNCVQPEASRDVACAAYLWGTLHYLLPPSGSLSPQLVFFDLQTCENQGRV